MILRGYQGAQSVFEVEENVYGSGAVLIGEGEHGEGAGNAAGKGVAREGNRKCGERKYSESADW